MTSSQGTIDSHHHFWDLTRLDYVWMPLGPSVVRQNYLPPELRPEIEAVGIGRTVVVQAHQSLDEAKFLLDIAKRTDFVAGVVAWVDVQSPNVGDDLDLLMREGGLVGVRHQVEDDPDDDWLIAEETIRGLREIAARGLAYDVLVRPRHMKHVPTVGEQVPNLRMVIDHIAKPMIADAIVEPWATDMTKIASIPGVYCKVSGMVTEANHHNWKVEDLRPYVAHVREQFGMDRLMFGSDWPVCLLASSYGRVLEAALEAMGAMTQDEHSLFLGGNARRFYRL